MTTDITNTMNVLQSLQRNKTTVDQAIQIESAKANLFKPGKDHSPRYWELLKHRSELPVAKQRHAVLENYHDNQVSKTYFL